MAANLDYMQGYYGSIAAESAGANTAAKAATSNIALIQSKIAQLQTMVSQFNNATLTTKYSQSLASLTNPSADGQQSVLIQWQTFAQQANDAANFIKTLVTKVSAIIAASDAKFSKKRIPGGADNGKSPGFGGYALTLAKPSEYACQQALLTKYQVDSSGKPIANNNAFGFGYSYDPTSGACNIIPGQADPNMRFAYFDDPTADNPVKYYADGFGNTLNPLTRDLAGSGMSAIIPNTCAFECMASGEDCAWFVDSTLPPTQGRGCKVGSTSKGVGSYGVSSGVITRMRTDIQTSK